MPHFCENLSQSFETFLAERYAMLNVLANQIGLNWSCDFKEPFFELYNQRSVALCQKTFITSDPGFCGQHIQTLLLEGKVYTSNPLIKSSHYVLK